MKKLTLLFIMSFSATAGFYSAPFTEIEKKLLDCDYSITFFRKCEGYCAEITKDFNCNYSEIYEELVDDLSKPVYSKNEVQECEGEESCYADVFDKKCLDEEEEVLIGAEFSEIYCSKLLRYEQKKSGVKNLVVNEIKKQAYESAQSAKNAKEAALAMAGKAIDCGKRVISMLVVQNSSKGLTTDQIKAMNVTYSDIKDLLETGSLDSAREEIEAQPVAEPLVTATDKMVLMAELDLCKP